MQVFSQPLFANIEHLIQSRFPNSEFVNRTYALPLPLMPDFELNFLRIAFRTACVALSVIVAMIFPYLNLILGVLGGLNFWPLAIYFPVEMYMRISNIEVWTTRWVMLRAFGIFCFLLGYFACLGSIEGIILRISR